jgi:cell wall-associated NlpC family hydrolase
VSGGFVASAVAAGVLLAVLGHHSRTAGAAPGKPAVAAIAYARAQVGKPYEWGGTGPDAFDCSGLVMRAYASAGVSIARTSQAQWATEPHVSDPASGDLVFFAGADGTASAPGHVGLVVDPARDLMIDAYAPGVPIHEETYGRPGSAPGLQDPVGFTDPSGGS